MCPVVRRTRGRRLTGRRRHHTSVGLASVHLVSLSAALPVPPQRASRGWSRVGTRWRCAEPVGSLPLSTAPPGGGTRPFGDCVTAEGDEARQNSVWLADRPGGAGCTARARSRHLPPR